MMVKNIDQQGASTSYSKRPGSYITPHSQSPKPCLWENDVDEEDVPDTDTLPPDPPMLRYEGKGKMSDKTGLTAKGKSSG